MESPTAKAHPANERCQKRTIPSLRLVTRNLLASACTYEHAQEITMSNVQDLAARINLMVLYDGVESLVLEPGWHSELMNYSNLAKALITDRAITILSLSKDDRAAAVALATKELSAFLRKDMSSLHKDMDNAVNEATNPTCSEDCSDFDDGERWLKERRSTNLKVWTASPKDLSGQDSDEFRFFLRSFFYIGYSQQTGRRFVLDSGRLNAINRITLWNSFQKKLLERINHVYRADIERSLQASQFIIPPFAAVVFQRAGTDKAKIVCELLELREQFKELRTRLYNWESRSRVGVSHDRFLSIFHSRLSSTDEELREIQDGFERALLTVGQRTTPFSRMRIFTKPLFELAVASLEIIGGMHHLALEEIIKGLLGFIFAPGPPELRETYQRSALAEVHGLDREIRHWYKEGTLDRLFGTVREEAATPHGAEYSIRA
jgi:hypothetical protein